MTKDMTKDKRKLTDIEIEELLDFIKPSPRIPQETAQSIVSINKTKLIKQLKSQEIYPSMIPELKKELCKNYFDSQINPGESIGILCAQSIGEKNTQNTLNTLTFKSRKQGKLYKNITSL